MLGIQSPTFAHLAVAPARCFPKRLSRWNTNEEVLAILLGSQLNDDWVSAGMKACPASGSMFLYNKRYSNYRSDGFTWKKRKADVSRPREDHMRLKVYGVECIVAYYAHSAIVPTFHRRTYYLKSNPDVVLVHYLNVPTAEPLMVNKVVRSIQNHLHNHSRDKLFAQVKAILGCCDEEASDAAQNRLNMIFDLALNSTDEPEAELAPCVTSSSSSAGQISDRLISPCRTPTGNTGDTSGHILGKNGFGYGKTGDLNALLSVATAPAVSEPGLISPPVYSQSSGSISSATSTPATSRSVNYPHLSTSVTDAGRMRSVNFGSPPAFREFCGPPSDAGLAEHIGVASNDSSARLDSQSITQTGFFDSLVATQMEIIDRPVHRPDTQTPIPNRYAVAVCCDQTKNRIFPPSVSCSTSNVMLGQDPMNANLTPSNTACSVSSSLHATSYGVDLGARFTKDVGLVSSALVSTPSPSALFPLDNGMTTKTCLSATGGQSDQGLNCSLGLTSEDIQQTLTANFYGMDDPLGHESAVSGLDPTSNSSVSGNSVHDLETHANPTPMELGNEPSYLIPSDDDLYHCLASVRDAVSLDSPPQEEASRDGVVTLRISSDLASTSSPHCLPVSTTSTFDVSASSTQSHASAPHSTNDSTPNAAAARIGDPGKMESRVQQLQKKKPSDPGSGEMLPHDSQKGATEPHQANNRTEGSARKVEGFDQSSIVATITDFSPEWAYTDGNTKLLVSGPWYSSHLQYFCVFDGSVSVSASVVQPGVLKCYCPAHPAGVVSLQVACDGQQHVVSNAVHFEYRSCPPRVQPLPVGKASDWLQASDDQFVAALLERFDLVGGCLSCAEQCKNLTSDLQASTKVHTSLGLDELERRFIAIVQKMVQFDWSADSKTVPFDWSPDSIPANQRSTEHRSTAPRLRHHFGLIIMHIAAALGFTRLIQLLNCWSLEKPNDILSKEIDLLSRDDNGYAPLTYACLRNKLETASELVSLNRDSLFCPNSAGELPLVVAYRAGHHNLVRALVVSDLESSGAINVDTVLWVLTSGQVNSRQLFAENFDALSLLSTSLCTPANQIPSAGIANTGGGQMANSAAAMTSCGDQQLANTGGQLANNNSAAATPSCSSLSVLARCSSASNSVSSNFLPDVSSPGGSTAEYNNSFYGSFDMSSPGACSGASGSNKAQSRRNLARQQSLDSALFNIKMNLFGCIDDIFENVDDEDELRFAPSPQSGGKSGGIHRRNTFSSGDVTAIEMEMNDHQAQLVRLAHHFIAALPNRIKDEEDCGGGVDPHGIASYRRTEQSSDHDYGQQQNFFGTTSYSACSQASTSTVDHHTADNEHRSTAVIGGNGPIGDGFNNSSTMIGADQSIKMIGGATSPMIGCWGDRPFSDEFARPASAAPPTSPASSISMGEELDEFVNPSPKSKAKLEKDFQQLTLNDSEQRELYAAAKVIQTAYRNYKARALQMARERVETEREAAVLIQSYYRRYKEYCYYKRLHQAAVLIQKHFRMYRSSKGQGSPAGRHHRLPTPGPHHVIPGKPDEMLSAWRKHLAAIRIQHAYRGHCLRKRHAAARKIQRFMRESRQKLLKERSSCAAGARAE